MRFSTIRLTREIQRAEGPKSVFYACDTLSILPALTGAYASSVKCAYLDPPFLTGKDFRMDTAFGPVTAYTDRSDRESYFSDMEKIIRGVYGMLSDDGCMFLHIDYRANARSRLICDEIFGERNFLNEIIWSYHSGGSSLNHFPRKHDVILFYRKSPEFRFLGQNVLEERTEPPSNHMRRRIDSDGRAYRTIKTNGKVYTYYEDEPVLPTDVWDDISHLQQKDSERTGYPTQKPVRLLKRILGCACSKGDIVMDLFAGSGTSLYTANALGCGFIGADSSPLSLMTVRKRLKGANIEYIFPERADDGEEIDAFYQTGVGVTYITVSGFTKDGLDNIELLASGYIEGDTFIQMNEMTGEEAKKSGYEIKMPEMDGKIGVRITDRAGTDRYWALN